MSKPRPNPFAPYSWHELFPLSVSMQTCDHYVEPCYMPLIHGKAIEFDGRRKRIFRKVYKRPR
jgi:hypothetical protein